MAHVDDKDKLLWYNDSLLENELKESYGRLLLVDAMIKGTKMYKHAFGRYRLPHCH